jgi:RNA polymerase sigma factor (sigma-70 family)
MPANNQNDSFLAVFLKYRKRLEAFVSRMVGPAWSADIVQDLFIRLWDRPIERPDTIAPYLFRAAHNLAIDHLRSERVRTRFSSSQFFDDAVSNVAEPDLASVWDELEVLAQALRQLPERTSTVFLLNKCHGRSYPEISQALGISVKTVEREMVRALAACAAAKKS